MNVQQALGPKGPLADQLSDYQPREQQSQMADAVRTALDNSHSLMVEAGTGVGKSFAYLVPAILWLREDPKRKLVVSTHTIGLQEQLIQKDLPILEKAFPGDFRAVLVKGRSNYISLRRLQVALTRSRSLLDEPESIKQLTGIARWARDAKEGSRSELPMTPRPGVWGLVESDAGNCLGRKCKTFSRCYFFRARREIADANLLIVNHAFFFRDLSLRQEPNGGILPKYDGVIFDEAHTIEDVASDQLGIGVSQVVLENLYNRLFIPRRASGLLALMGDEDTILQLQRTRQATDRFFSELNDWMQRSTALNVRVKETNIVTDVLSEELLKLATRINGIGESIPDEADRIEWTSIENRLLEARKSLSDWLGQRLPAYVYWLEKSLGRTPRISISASPIDVGPTLQDRLYQHVNTLILTSATLGAGERSSFEHLRRRLSLQHAKTLQLGSPFPFEKLVELYLFKSIPDPASQVNLYEEKVIELLPKYIAKTEGRAFVLFTSYAFLQKARKALEEKLDRQGYQLFVQGDGAGPGQLLERFKNAERGVLFGVDTFWQGIDVKGESLSNVIITKLPFASPSQPIVEARSEAIESRGGSSFFEYSLPSAVIKLKQGFGRLIRTETDRGQVVIFDPRVLTKGYGRQFLDALPTCKTFIDEVAQRPSGMISSR
jgi:ATP-dependent DNA helicase DinG